MLFAFVAFAVTLALAFCALDFSLVSAFRSELRGFSPVTFSLDFEPTRLVGVARDADGLAAFPLRVIGAFPVAPDEPFPVVLLLGDPSLPSRSRLATFSADFEDAPPFDGGLGRIAVPRSRRGSAASPCAISREGSPVGE